MKQKTLTLIITAIFLVGIVTMLTGFVSAERMIDNATGIYIEDFVAGSTVQANFSYDYLRDRPENPDNSPLILRINITSSDEVNFPVWRGDFGVSGFIKRYILFGLIPIGGKDFTCSEQESQTIIHPLGNEPVSAENGTFYCYDPQGDLDFGDFNAHDIVYLDITSNPALWPGEYGLSAELYYLTDTYPPIVNITNKADFETKYYRENDNFNIQVLVEEGGEISNVWGTVYLDEENISFYPYDDSGGTYYFSQMTPSDIQEGDYNLTIFAEDTSGNVGNDSTILMIDRTPPEIELVEPVGVVSEVFSIKFNVTDDKAGVDNETVQARLREIKEGIGICPETGGPINGTGCITTSWINLTLTNGLFEVDINTTYYNLTSGSYWLDARASDILGNEANWIA